MGVSFSNNSHVCELIGQMQIGQVIKVEVLEKKDSTHYLVSHRNIQFTAASEVDLFTKSVWLRLKQKHPIPKLQIIVEDNNSAMTGLLEHAEKSNLILPSIPKQLRDLLTNYQGRVNPHEFYGFIGLYTDMYGFGLFSDKLLVHLLNEGVSFGDIGFLYELNPPLPPFKKGGDNGCPPLTLPQEGNNSCSVKLLSVQDDIDGFVTEPMLKERLSTMMHIVENINILLVNHGLQIALLYINHPLFLTVIPVECVTHNVSKSMNGLVKTKHFGNIVFKYGCQVQKREIQFIFESGLYLESMKVLLNKYVKSDICIGFAVNSHPYMESRLHGDRSIVV